MMAATTAAMTHDDDRPRRPETPPMSLPATWRGLAAVAGLAPTAAVVIMTPTSGQVAAAIVGAAIVVGHAWAVSVVPRTGPAVVAVWTAIVAAALIVGPWWIVGSPIGWLALPVVAAPAFAGSVAAAVAGLALAAAAGLGATIAGASAPGLVAAVLAAVGVMAAVERRRGEARSDALARRDVELAGLRAELQELRGQHDDGEAQQVALMRENHQLRSEVEHGRAVLGQALDTSRTKTSFLLKVSHELRTPLNAVVGYTEMLLEHQADGRSAAELRADLERILGSAHHLLAVIDDVLDLARIEAGKYEVTLTTFALADVIDEAAAAV
jgi:signal transduction histidine kinase